MIKMTDNYHDHLEDFINACPDTLAAMIFDHAAESGIGVHTHVTHEEYQLLLYDYDLSENDAKLLVEFNRIAKERLVHETSSDRWRINQKVGNFFFKWMIMQIKALNAEELFNIYLISLR